MPPGQDAEEAKKHPAEDQPARSPEETEFDDTIFRRDLYEVHLLIDFISGRTDKTLDDLEVARGSDTLKGAKVIEEITAIRFPPAGTRRQRSADAALLLGAKNKLNMLAQPARGLTVAFTAMFVGLGYQRYPAAPESLRWRVWRMLMAPIDRFVAWATMATDRKEAPQQRVEFESLARSRVGLARNAFPGLVQPVRRLRWVLTGLMFFFFLFWLPLTAITYWDVSFLKATLQPLEQAARDRASLKLANPLFDEGDCSSAPRTPTTEANPLRVACKRIDDIKVREDAARDELAQFLGCRDVFACQFFHAIRWRGVLFNAELAGAGQLAVVREQYAVALLAVFANYVLPMMFGLLGAGVRMLRVVQYKLRDSLLGPRDLVLTFIGLLIGAIAGVAVGLFLAPTDVSLGGSAGNLTLTAAGLGFLVGYGSDHFLQMLDSLLDRIFVADPAPSDAPPKPAASNARPPGG